ncbi:hypothetical protein [Pseudomonas lopnurensis]|uniref:hypothetical protein n=1 Tax=Pseudomonas lopnurensis TaxID=1477517 RepID=UPI0028ACD2C3|nr:hypothetical protein [Pseudomonas lopnurensis]
MARHQQAQSSSHWQKAGYEAGVELKRLRRSLAGAEQRLIQRAGEQAHWMRLGLLLLKVLVAVAVVAAFAVAAFWMLVWVVLPAVVVLGAFLIGGGAGRNDANDDDDLIYSCRPDGYYTGSFRDGDDD